MTPKLGLHVAILALALFGLGQAGATDNAGWSSLTTSQQKTLAPLQRDWNTIEASRRAKWIELAARFPSMPKEEQARIQERMAEWARMTPADRNRARLQFQEAKQVPAIDRKAQWEAYQALPPAQREALAQTAKQSAKTGSTPATAGTVASAGSAPQGKRNLVQATGPGNTKPLASITQQAKPGATTTTMTTRPQQPAHQQAGLPKIAATPGFVDPSTLLPKRGPQGAAVRSASASSEPAAQGQ